MSRHNRGPQTRIQTFLSEAHRESEDKINLDLLQNWTSLIDQHQLQQPGLICLHLQEHHFVHGFAVPVSATWRIRVHSDSVSSAMQQQWHQIPAACGFATNSYLRLCFDETPASPLTNKGVTHQLTNLKLLSHERIYDMKEIWLIKHVAAVRFCLCRLMWLLSGSFVKSKKFVKLISDAHIFSCVVLWPLSEHTSIVGTFNSDWLYMSSQWWQAVMSLSQMYFMLIMVGFCRIRSS